jgi:hypothetical protein
MATFFDVVRVVACRIVLSSPLVSGSSCCRLADCSRISQPRLILQTCGGYPCLHRGHVLPSSTVVVMATETTCSTVATAFTGVAIAAAKELTGMQPESDCSCVPVSLHIDIPTAFSPVLCGDKVGSLPFAIRSHEWLSIQP